jgi:predicted metal-dependent hydrolase
MDDIRIDTIIRTKRRSIALQVNEHAEVVVRAPRWVARKYIDAFVRSHQTWIVEQQSQKRAQKKIQRRYVDGEIFLFLGDELQLKRDNGKNVRLRDKVLLLGKEVKDPGYQVEKWYRAQARIYLTNLCESLAKEYGDEFAAVRITGAKTRWGSCSSKKNLSFSWRLMMAPEEVVRYVVIHELTHLRHMDHSKAFWECVQLRCPNYIRSKKWLNDNAERLMV